MKRKKPTVCIFDDLHICHVRMCEPVRTLTDTASIQGHCCHTVLITGQLQPGWNHRLQHALCVQFMSNPGAAVFFMVFITVCAFCMIQLYVGVVFFQFSRIRAQSEAGTRNTEYEQLQRQWLELAKLAFRTRPKEIPPPQKLWLRAVARSIASSKKFDAMIMVRSFCCRTVYVPCSSHGNKHCECDCRALLS